jgi:fibrillarin-like pre-rRNA processing protein
MREESIEEIAEGVFRISLGDGKTGLATLNLAAGVDVYSEPLVEINGREYRFWDPHRSKLAAALLKGLGSLKISPGSRVLYLGASTGTTVSHVSDIVGPNGIVFAVEVSPRVARELMERVARFRRNVIPIIEDARRPDSYNSVFGLVDVVYCDIAQPDQSLIAIQNCRRYLKDGGTLLLVVKARSIDVLKDPKRVVREEACRLQSEGFTVEQVLFLDPFDKDHGMIAARYKKILND